MRPTPARHTPDCPEGASAKDATASKTHSPGGGGSGLAQHVFHSPARIPATESSTGRPVRRAAKRKTLYVIIRKKHGRAGRGARLGDLPIDRTRNVYSATACRGGRPRRAGGVAAGTDGGGAGGAKGFVRARCSRPASTVAPRSPAPPSGSSPASPTSPVPQQHGLARAMTNFRICGYPATSSAAVKERPRPPRATGPPAPTSIPSDAPRRLPTCRC